MVKSITSGSPTAPLWLVGEAPGEYEVQRGIPFTGPAGRELDSLLREAGIDRAACYLTNICHERPPSYTDRKGRVIHNDIEQFFLTATEAKRRGVAPLHGRFPLPPVRDGLRLLLSSLLEHRPRLVLALGNTPLWGTCGEVGITKWRGSLFEPNEARPCRVLCTFHPADVLPNRNPHHRPILLHDLHRAARELANPTQPPQWNFTIPRTVHEAVDWLADAATPDTPLVCDIETRTNQIACIGLASSATTAICIPFMRATPTDSTGHSYWSLEDEQAVLAILLHVLRTNPLTFHNAIFDIQYLARQWGILPDLAKLDDTMVMQHVAFPGFLGGKIDPVSGRVDKRGSSLSLSFISSLYCNHYRFWKDDGRLFDPLSDDEVQLWHYNCEDCCRTFECKEVLERILGKSNLTPQYRFQMDLFAPTLKMMFRGLRIDRSYMMRCADHIRDDMKATRAWLNEATGCDFNPESTPQMRALFYDDLRLAPIRNKHTKALTLDDAALEKIARQNPLLRPLVQQIQHYRTLDTVKDVVDPAHLSPDGRLRSTINIGYVETMRFSSNETAFGEGLNLQNLPRPPEERAMTTLA
jgi:uracil-DNA glycosylase